MKRKTHVENKENGRPTKFSCLICRKEKFAKRSRSREKTVPLDQAIETLREYATKANDQRILSQLNSSTGPNGLLFHRTCYKAYTRRDTRVSSSQHRAELNEYVADHSEPWQELFDYIQTDIIEKGRIETLSGLMHQFREKMREKGYGAIRESTRTHFRRTLERQFPAAIQIFPNDDGKLVVISSSLTIEQVVKRNIALQNEVDDLKSKLKETALIDNAAAVIRSEIQSTHYENPWPYYPSDVDENSFQMPHHLERFLLASLIGDGKCEDPSQRSTILVKSFAQDFVYAITNGKHKPPKHLLLPYTIKALTGNVELIGIMNRLGHAISYSQLQENDTALCLHKLEITSEKGGQIPLPSTLRPFTFTVLAFDNIDRLEETLSGKGTSHRVNGIAVQRKSLSEAATPKAIRMPKMKQRSITPNKETLEVYVAGERVGPQGIKTDTSKLKHAETAAEISRQKNLIWIITRENHKDAQSVPSWTGFNIKTRDAKRIQQDTLSYLPTIDAPATELSTVLEVLRRAECCRQELHLESIVVVMDQALFAKAAEIAWKKKLEYQNILLVMGAFHTTCNALSIMGKRFEDAGLRDLCVESGLLAEGSCAGVFNGKMYNRATRAHKCIYEAFMRLIWYEFSNWLKETKQVQPILNEKAYTELATSQGEAVLTSLLESEEFRELHAHWAEFLDVLRYHNGNLCAFWMSYIDMVDILLGLLRASREGDWSLHLHANESLLPWCFAYDKINYARYLTANLAQLTQLEKDYPEVEEAFADGQFAVQMSATNPFGRIPVDQATEVTINRDTKTPGGTTGFSLNAGAVQRHYITAEHRCAFVGLMRDFVNVASPHEAHADLNESRRKKDEEVVTAIESLLQSWVNPFSLSNGHESKSIISISTAREVPQEIAADLMNAHTVGKECLTKFREERLEGSQGEKKFHDRLKLNKLKTFADVQSKKRINIGSKTFILKADRSLFGRIIVIAQSRQLQMRDVLAHPLGPLPWTLATPQGTLRKTSKAIFAQHLQKKILLTEEIPENCTIIDGMSLVHHLCGNPGTFGDVATLLLEMALRSATNSKRIDIVFDTYQELSIKAMERKVRGSGEGHQLQNITASHKVLQWRKYLTQVENKSSLISFLVEEWRKSEFRQTVGTKKLVVTCGRECFEITSGGSRLVPELCSSQEEADTRIFLHAAHAAREGYGAVVIASEDSDVTILGLSLQDKIPSTIYQRMKARGHAKIFNISEMAEAWSPLRSAMVGIHAFTGCDTVSAFAGKGKISALKLIATSEEWHQAFADLGKQWEVPEELYQKLEAFTCIWYGAKATTSINDLRYNIFCAKKGEIESHQLPPCKDTLYKHIKRANYQAAIWKRSLERAPAVPSPVGRGWLLSNEDLMPHWMDGFPAPEAVLDLLSCNCSKSCSPNKCICMQNGLKCTDMCKLKGCSNIGPTEDSEGNAPIRTSLMR